jgi:hypothetical protein
MSISVNLRPHWRRLHPASAHGLWTHIWGGREILGISGHEFEGIDPRGGGDKRVHCFNRAARDCAFGGNIAPSQGNIVIDGQYPPVEALQKLSAQPFLKAPARLSGGNRAMLYRNSASVTTLRNT